MDGGHSENPTHGRTARKPAQEFPPTAIQPPGHLPPAAGRQGEGRSMPRSAGKTRKAPAEPGVRALRLGECLQAVEDLVGPEPLQPVQRFVQSHELLGVDSPHLLDRAYLLLVQALYDIADARALG